MDYMRPVFHKYNSWKLSAIATFTYNTVIIYFCEIFAHLKAWRAFKIENHP